MGPLLGQSGASGATLLWVSVLVGVVVGASGLVLLIRRRVLVQRGAEGDGLTLEDLRRMRDRGDIDADEFQRARDVVLGGAIGSGPRQVQTPFGEELRAAPGVDLTGQPLPPVEGDESGSRGPDTSDEGPDSLEDGADGERRT